MLLPLMLAALAYSTQSVRVTGPSREAIAAAALPIPPVVLSRAEADALSDVALAERLIGHFPHRPIARVHRQRDDPPDLPSTSRALRWAAFDEAGVPIGGRLCRSRKIHVTFDAMRDGGTTGDGFDRLQRVFWVHQTPTIAIAAGKATGARCAEARSVSVAPGEIEAVVPMIRTLMAGGAAPGRPGPVMTCLDQSASPSRRCDPRAMLRSMDWTQLLRASAAGSAGVPIDWRFSVGAGSGIWTIAVSDRADGRRVDIRRETIAPF